MKLCQIIVLVVFLAGSRADSVDLTTSCTKLVTLINDYFEYYVTKFPIINGKTPELSDNYWTHFIKFPFKEVPGSCKAEVQGSQADVTVGFLFDGTFEFTSDSFNLNVTNVNAKAYLSAKKLDNGKLSLEVKNIEIIDIEKVFKVKDGKVEDVTRSLKEILKNEMTKALQLGYKNADLGDMDPKAVDNEIFGSITFAYAYRFMFELARQTGVYTKPLL